MQAMQVDRMTENTQLQSLRGAGGRQGGNACFYAVTAYEQLALYISSLQ